MFTKEEFKVWGGKVSRGSYYGFPQIKTIWVSSKARITDDFISINKMSAYYDDRSMKIFKG